MRLAILFICFLFGLFLASSFGMRTHGFAEIFLILIATCGSVATRNYRLLHFSFISLAAMLFGLVWFANMPTWPAPLRIENLPFDSCCTITGRAVGEAFVTSDKRFIPVRIDAVRPAGLNEDGSTFVGNWKRETGVVIVETGREFMPVPGARYSVHGRFIYDPDHLHGPFFLRYRPRGAVMWHQSSSEITQLAPPGLLANFGNHFRNLLISHLSWGLGNAEGELVAGIVFGRMTRRLGGDWTRDFYQAGLSHLIVASGAQISLLFLPLFFLLARIRLPSKLKWVILAVLGLILFGFAKLLGGEPSILRAATMGCILLLAIGIGRQTYGIATLSAAGFYWLIQNPLLIRDAGFLLSFAATYGIIYLCTPALGAISSERRIYKPDLKRWFFFSTVHENLSQIVQNAARLIIDWAAVTLTAQIAVFPVLACVIGKLSFSGFIANLFAVPIAEIILYLGALSGLAGFINPMISVRINGVLDNLARVLMTIAHDFANLPGAVIPVEPLPGWTAVAYYLAIVITVETYTARHRHPMELKHRGFRSRKKGIPSSPETIDDIPHGELFDIEDSLPPDA